MACLVATACAPSSDVQTRDNVALAEQKGDAPSGAGLAVPTPHNATAQRTGSGAPSARPPSTIMQPWSIAGRITATGFNPDNITVAAGYRVTVRNADSRPHTWTSDQGFWDSGVLQPGQAFSVDFLTPGTFPFHDRLDSSIRGSVTAKLAR